MDTYAYAQMRRREVSGMHIREVFDEVYSEGFVNNCR